MFPPWNKPAFSMRWDHPSWRLTTGQSLRASLEPFCFGRIAIAIFIFIYSYYIDVWHIIFCSICVCRDCCMYHYGCCYLCSSLLYFHLLAPNQMHGKPYARCIIWCTCWCACIHAPMHLLSKAMLAKHCPWESTQLLQGVSTKWLLYSLAPPCANGSLTKTLSLSLGLHPATSH